MAKESKLAQSIEKGLMPIATKLSRNKVLMSIRDGMTAAMPLIIIGSFFMILNNFPVQGWTDWLNNTVINKVSIAQIFNKIINGSYGLLGIISTFGIAASFAEHQHTDGISAGVIATSSYFIVTPSIFTKASEGMPYLYLGSKGIFVGIIIGLLTGKIYSWFVKNNIVIKLPDSVPPAVGKSFSALIPATVIIMLFGAVYALFTWTGLVNAHEIILQVFSGPLHLLGDTLVGTVIAIMLNSLFWFVGIHGGSVVNSIMSPMWLMNADSNRALLKAGHLDLAHGGHIITQSFIEQFVYIGGGGATLGLVLGIGILVMMHKASKQLELLAPITIPPGFFQINEPVLFGLPVILNATFLIPLFIVPVINGIISYFAMLLKIVPLSTGAVVPWTMPAVISGFLATNSVMGSILQIILIVIDITLYLPFLKMISRAQIIEEDK